MGVVEKESISVRQGQTYRTGRQGEQQYEQGQTHRRGRQGEQERATRTDTFVW